MNTNETLTGCMIAQRLTKALTGLGIPYDRLSEIIYKECQEITYEQELGDWLCMPDGSTYELTFKPTRKAERKEA